LVRYRALPALHSRLPVAAAVSDPGLLGIHRQSVRPLGEFDSAYRKQFASIFQVIKVDILQIKLEGAISLGHNMLACSAYVFFFLAIIFQVVTGFALYDSMSNTWFASLFTWVIPLMGGDMVVRQWHHLATWFFAVFILIHVYLVIYHDYVEGRGTTSAMIGGWKFEHKHGLR
jgi:Ni/Fe-hydrogenase 1 B-type cytochrome subunit